MKRDIIYPGTAPKNAAPLPKNNVFRIRMIGILEGQMTSNVFYYRDNKGPHTALAEQLTEVNDLFTGLGGLGGEILAATTTAWIWNSTEVDCPTSPTLATLSTAAGVLGQLAPPTLPNQMAVTVAKITAWRGKQGRGRVSIPAVPATLTTQSRLTDQSKHAVIAAQMPMTMNGAAVTYTPGLYAPHKVYEDGSIAQESFVDMTSAVVRVVLGTARRRKIGVGR